MFGTDIALAEHDLTFAIPQTPQHSSCAEFEGSALHSPRRWNSSFGTRRGFDNQPFCFVRNPSSPLRNGLSYRNVQQGFNTLRILDFNDGRPSKDFDYVGESGLIQFWKIDLVIFSIRNYGLLFF